jgi:hypothetical protein
LSDVTLRTTHHILHCSYHTQTRAPMTQQLSSSQNSILVTNIDPSTTQATINDFFAFCGKIESLSMSQASDGTLQAVVVFESPTAAKTALLLNSALINERPITVQQANLESEQRAKTDKQTEVVNKTNLPPPEQRSKTSVIASILAAGYKLSHDALEKAKQYDESIGFSETIKQKLQEGVSKVKEVDEKLGVSTKAKELGDKVNQTITGLDQKFGVTTTVSAVAETANDFVMGVSQRVTSAVDTVTDKALKYVTSNETIQAGVQKVRQLQDSVAQTVNQIKEETQQLIARGQTPPSQHEQQQPQPAEAQSAPPSHPSESEQPPAPPQPQPIPQSNPPPDQPQQPPVESKVSTQEPQRGEVEVAPDSSHP